MRRSVTSSRRRARGAGLGEKCCWDSPSEAKRGRAIPVQNQKHSGDAGAGLLVSRCWHEKRSSTPERQQPMTSVTVSVTQEDIDKAIRSDSYKCVVVQAIARTMPKAHRISVDIHGGIRFTEGSKRYTYLMPAKVEQYVIAFDAGETLHPFKFQLRSDQRLVVTRQHRTDAGAEVKRAAEKVRRTQRRAEAIAADPAASEAAKTLAREKAAAAEADRRVVAATLANTPQTVIEKHDDVARANDGGAIQVKPRSGKRTTLSGGKTRSYGHRALRINWLEQPEPGDFRGPLDTE